MSSSDERVPGFARNEELERLLQELNSSLGRVDSDFIPEEAPAEDHLPIVFIVGPARSGTTLLMQWLANTGVVAYPTNLLSRFYSAPLIGARIQRLLCDPRFDFRGELQDVEHRLSYRSDNGKTAGMLAPNEFWYFWRAFLQPEAEEARASPGAECTVERVDWARRRLTGLASFAAKPFALKAMILNEDIGFLSNLVPNYLIVRLKRDETFNVQSLLSARRRQFGSYDHWYSFEIPEVSYLKELSPVDAVAGQVTLTNRRIDDGMSSIPESRQLTVTYEGFCERPEAFYRELTRALTSMMRSESEFPDYRGEPSFSISNEWHLEDITQSEVDGALSRWHRELDERAL